MRGRKPLPTAWRLLRNNPGKRAINWNEPAHDPLPLEVPKELRDSKGKGAEAAREEWNRIARVLIERGQVTEVDRSTLLAYCHKYGQWRALEDEAAAHPFIVATPSGYPIPNPALGMANKVYALMLKAAAELGITPSSRSRVSASKGAKKSKVQAFQDAKRKTG